MRVEGFALPRRRSPVRTRCSAPNKSPVLLEKSSNAGLSVLAVFAGLDPRWTQRLRLHTCDQSLGGAQHRVIIGIEFFADLRLVPAPGDGHRFTLRPAFHLVVRVAGAARIAARRLP
jgi:hypothetical protein